MSAELDRRQLLAGLAAAAIAPVLPPIRYGSGCLVRGWCFAGGNYYCEGTAGESLMAGEAVVFHRGAYWRAMPRIEP